ncbi:MAG TPA: transposase [Candidatus Thermoplasmatota archaeon]|nr:transposase [Candidatus Thermoplasmatota archaeon]
MPRITKFPPFGKRFFRRARKLVGRCHFEHFWRAVCAIASLHGRRSIQRLRDLLGGYRTRQAIASFLNHATWNAPGLLRETALDTLQRLGYRPGDTVYVVLDDTQKRKRGKVMAAVSKIFLHAEKAFAKGHTVLGCALLYRGVLIPYAVRLWATPECCAGTQAEPDPEDRVPFRKLTALGAEVVQGVTLPAGARAVVLFDSYYLCAAVVTACQARRWPFVSVAKKNRNFAPDGRRRDKRKLGPYGRNVLDRCGRRCEVGGKEHRLAERVGWLSKVGRVKLVFSRRPRERSWVVLVTDQTRWGMRTVLSHYLLRWPIELLFKASKQYLGLGDYQVLRYRGVVRYLHLVLIAYLLLTHLAICGPGAQADVSGRGELRLPSIPELQERLRGLLWDSILTDLGKRKQTRAAAKKLREAVML